ncbi:MAG: ATP-binding cassette domain-containing protein, partial [Deltaproteobacteria bacterium]|nr:ATP-binding cassette domain-containing protein [Deltaproteobacteria bacterium]
MGAPAVRRTTPDRSGTESGDLVVFDRVAHSFPGGNGGGLTEAVADFSLGMERGSFVCLLGPSGCGKSTLLNLLAGFEPPSRGRVLVGGQPVTGPGPDRGVVFQEANLLPWRTVLRNITLGPELAGRPHKETLAAARRFIGLT